MARAKKTVNKAATGAKPTSAYYGAPGPTSGKVGQFGEIGSTGLLRTGIRGVVYEEFLKDLWGERARRIYREMRDNDAAIGAMFFAIEMVARNVDWRVEGDNQEQVDFIQECMEDMQETWEDFIIEALSMLTFGFSWHEIILKRRNGTKGNDSGAYSRFTDGKIGWRNLPIRAQETLLEWEWNDVGDVQNFVQVAPPMYNRVEIPIERSLLFRTGQHKNNPEGRSLLRNCYRCFSDDTEVLSASGWMPMRAATEETKVATLTPQGKLTYEYPDEVMHYHYNGEMVHIHGRFLDQLVTPNHNCYARRAHKDEYEDIEAADLTLTSRFKAHADWVGQESKTYTIPEYSFGEKMYGGPFSKPKKVVPMDDWLRFLGIWLAEGHTYRRKTGTMQATVGITQNRGDKLEKLRPWVEALGYGVYEHPHGSEKVVLEITNVQLWDLMRGFGKARKKFVPKYVKALSPRQIRLFLDSFHLGDGSTSGKETVIGEYGPYEGTPVYFTGSKKLANDLCELILKVGKVPRLKKVKGGFTGSTMWRVSELDATEHRATHIDFVPYNGDVHCLSVPPNHTVYVRRKGKCQWSGQSWLFKKHIEEVEGIGIERDLAGMPVIYRTAEIAAKHDDKLKEILLNVRRDEQEGVLLPLAWDEKGNKQLTFELLVSGSRRQFDVHQVIDRYNKTITMTVMADFIMLGQQQVGSFALMSSKTELFGMGVGAILKSIASVMNRIAIPRLLEVNGMKTDDPPKLVPGDTQEADLKELGGYITALAGAGAPLFPDDDLEDYLRGIADLPLKPEGSMAVPTPPKNPLMGAPGSVVPGAQNEPLAGAPGAVPDGGKPVQVPPKPKMPLNSPGKPKPRGPATR